MSSTAGLVIVPLLLLAAQLPSGVPGLETAELARGPYSRMHTLLEKTIFGVDVVSLEVRVDRPTQERFAQIARGQAYSGALAGRIVEAALDSADVFAALEFQRSVSLDRWVSEVRGSLEKASRSGLIEQSHARQVGDGLPVWFGMVADRGFRSGDRILYRGYPDRLRTVLVSSAGDVLLDQTDRGAWPRRTLLAGYFAPGTDFREPLVRSLLESQASGARSRP